MGGRLEGGAFAVQGVSIDSRTIEPGDLFVALAGERDGHDFIPTALERGAAGILAFAWLAGGPMLLAIGAAAVAAGALAPRVTGRD